MSEIISSLRQGNNFVKIVGTLAEMNLEKVTTSDGKNVIRGNVVVEISPTEKHQVQYYANEFTQKGEVSKYYKGLETAMAEYISKAKALKTGLSEEEATKVEIRANFSPNDFISKKTGEIVSAINLRANTISRCAEEFDPKATFDVEIYIEKMAKEMDENSNPTGRVIIDGILPLYQGAVTPIRFFTATDNEFVNVGEYILAHYEEGKTVHIRGNIASTPEVKEYVHTGFGAPASTTTFTTYKVENIIYDGDEEPYLITDPKNFDKQAIKTAMLYRQEQLEKKKNGATPTETKTVSGFATPSAAKASTYVDNANVTTIEADEEVDF